MICGPVAAVCLGALLPGCATRPEAPPAPPAPARINLGPSGYGRAFDAVKDELRRLGFTLARVDAREGIITTEPLDSAGFATPWMQVESTDRQEVEGYLHRQRRRVEATFVDAGGAPAPDDLRLAESGLTLRIRVIEDRVHRPGVQLHTTSVRLANVARDPAMEAIGVQPSVASALGEDERLARRIADRLRPALEGPHDAGTGAGRQEREEATEGP